MIYVIGDSGYIGKNFCETLTDATCPFVGTSKLGGRNFLDILNPQTFNNLVQLTDHDQLVLFPWNVSGNYWKDSINKKYLHGYKILLQKLKDMDLNFHIIIAGTGAEVYGDIVEINSNYAESKRQLSKFSASIASAKLKITWIRIFHSFGRYETNNRLIPLLIQSALKKERLDLNNPDKLIHLTDIKFICKIFLELLSRPALEDFKIVNATTENVVKISDLQNFINCIPFCKTNKLITFKPKIAFNKKDLLGQKLLDKNGVYSLGDSILYHFKKNLFM